jgi:hypothetical protein
MDRSTTRFLNQLTYPLGAQLTWFSVCISGGTLRCDYSLVVHPSKWGKNPIIPSGKLT